jgi:predicted Zn finger-like uncharacterized protein
MRLICPNCDAQYEVDDSVIPKDGRDVQCSSCGQTWFQKSAAQMVADGEIPETVEPPTPAEEPAPEPEASIDSEDLAEAPSEPQEPPESEAEAEPEQEPRQTDESVLDILREEAALETEARQHDAQGGLETQPDLGLDQSDLTEEVAVGAAAATIGDRTAKLRGVEPEIDKSAARRDLLPDIEEINSTLRAETDAEEDEFEAEAPRKRSKFRLGFSIVLIMATALLLLYVYAPQIVQKYPASESFMISYVEKMNGLRDWLDQMMKLATDKMSGSGGS